MHIADDHSRWNDDLAAYAIGALDARDMAAFAKHLSECDRCRAELHRLAPAVELLPGAVEQLEPPPGLRGRIMAEVEAEAEVEGALAGGGAGAGARAGVGRARRRGGAGGGAPGGGSGGSGVGGRARGAGWWRTPRWRPAIAVAGVAAVAAAFAVGVLVGGDDGAGGQPTTAPVQALARATQIGGALVGDGDRWQLDVDGLPGLRAGREYQAWIMRDGAVRPSTLFVLDRDGHATVAISESLRDGDQVLVTSEPRGGSPQPTTRPLLSARV